MIKAISLKEHPVSITGVVRKDAREAVLEEVRYSENPYQLQRKQNVLKTL